MLGYQVLGGVMSFRAIRVAAVSLLALLGGVSSQGFAQKYPDKSIKMIVGFAAGGPTDIIARAIASDMSTTLGQSVVVENRTGASGIIATEAVLQSPPDGYNVLFAAHTHVVNTILIQTAKYDPVKDFAPITQICTLPLLLVTGPQSPFASARDVVAAAKAKPGEISYASAGIGTSGHLGGALFEMLSGAKMLHVPFRGNANAITEVMAGRVSYVFYPMIGVAEMVAGNKVKVLAVGTDKRHQDFQGVPTMAEAGFPGFVDTVPWLGALTRAGTPGPIVEQLKSAIQQSLAKPQTRDRLRELGAVTVGNSPAEFKEFLEHDKDRWARLIKAAGVQAQ